MISSGVLGGGIGRREWVLNAQVPAGYARTDPARHLTELAGRFGLTGPGIGMLTAAQVRDAGFAATGTATDAVCVAAQDPAGTAAADFAGPRSAWGARIARSVYAAVLAGATGYRASETPMEGT